MAHREKDRTRRPLSAGEFAARLGVSAGTARRWLRDGLLRGERIGDHGHWLVPRDEAERFEGSFRRTSE